MKIEYTIVDCELGKMLVARTEKGVCAVSFGDDENVLFEELTREFPKAAISENNSRLKEFVEKILEHLAGKKKKIDLPLDLRATAFQLRVWDALRKIPYGETVSYSQIAEQIGNKRAFRAVASSCAANRVAIVIPCHRVVKSNGEISGYRWGVERKTKILENESK